MDHGTTGKKTLATAAWNVIFTTLWTEWEPLLKTAQDKARLVSTAVKLKELYTTQKGTDTNAYNTANTNHSTADGEIAGLLTTANTYGYNDTTMTAGNHTGTKISALKTLKETAEALTTKCKNEYDAAVIQ